MKKLLLILAISLLLLSPIASSSYTAKPSHHLRPHRIMTDGNFSGIFAMKNDTGYIPLGSMSGTYSVSNSYGTFEGVWSLDSGNDSGTMTGYVWDHIFLGQLNSTTGNSSYFVGLNRVNETDNSFVAVCVIFTQDNYVVRYAMGDL